ncbi:MAG TPA: hypothetical protein VFK41_05805 [Nocardioidaceae bacterium]|nr:hypothetical protein [Nocardioidaceae bacterium]
MWLSLFPELLGPMILAFAVGSLVAWLAVGMILRPVPEDQPTEPPNGTRGP